MDEGYLVYGNRLYNYYGCDSSAYKFNDLIEDFISCSIAEDSRESYMTKEDALDCFRYCKENGVSANVLYNIVVSKTERIKELPTLDDMYFIGFDVAWKNYDYYSSILYDIISPHGLLQEDREKLNKFGLFNKMDSAVEYLQKRILHAKNNDAFEGGVFDVIAIYKVDW